MIWHRAFYRRAHGLRPKLANQRHDLLEFIVVGRFAEVSVRPKPVRTLNILGKVGIREDHRRDDTALRMILKPFEHLEAIHVGHLQIEQEHIRRTMAIAARSRIALQIVEALVAVLYNMQ